MSKRRKTTTPEARRAADVATIRAAARQADLDAGIRRRAWTAKNGRAVARREACRGRQGAE
jgi:hypothetical protein